MYTFHSLRLYRGWRVATHAGLGLLLALSFVLHAHAQAAQEGAPESGSSVSPGCILLVLPFDNLSGQPSLDWIREAAPEILSRRFTSAGFSPMSRVDRMYALDHLGLPQNFHPSRASSLKLAETLDADSIVVGSYMIDGTDIVAEARLVDVPHLRMSAAVTSRGEMHNMIPVFNSLAWKLTRQLDPNFKVSEQTFVATSAGLSLAAFEQYIRGITESDQSERLRHLNQSIHLSPNFSAAWMALGREDYSSQKYEEAALAFAKVSRNDPGALEAGFYGGLAMIFSGDYSQAERAFSDVARILPLAEVVNNEGVAVSRQNHDGTAFFRQAVAADPNAADYHFNLAVSLRHHGNQAEALTELGHCLRLRPSDSEAQALLSEWKEPVRSQYPGPYSNQRSSPYSDSPAQPNTDTLERIARGFDAVAFRQAAQMLDQMDASKLAALTPRQRSLKLAGQAKDYLDRGLLLEAERLYLSAITADGKVAEAHEGLAEVRELTGDAAAARREATVSLSIAPSVGAYLVQSRLDLAQGRLNDAKKEADQALRLDPQNKAAQELHKLIQSKAGWKKSGSD